MSTHVDVPQADGGLFTVEVDDGRATDAMMWSGREARTPTRTGETFEQAPARAAPASRVVPTQPRAAAERPAQIEVDFDVKGQHELGAIIAETGGEANFWVAIHWNRE
jgi:hypothetical protein